MLPEHRERIIETVGDPDHIRHSSHMGDAKLFAKWFANLRGGKHVVVVVISDPRRQSSPWIITAYMARKLAEGEIEWQKS